MLCSEEKVDIINEKDEVLRTVTRSEMRKGHLPHRATYALIMNGENRILTEIRTLSKDYAPGLLDACVGGVVQSGEDADLSVRREVEEEVGIREEDCSCFTSLGRLMIPHAVSDGFVMARLYFVRTDAVPRRQKEEVSGIMYLSFDELLRLRDVTTRDSVIAAREIMERAARLSLVKDAKDGTV